MSLEKQTDYQLSFVKDRQFIENRHSFGHSVEQPTLIKVNLCHYLQKFGQKRIIILFVLIFSFLLKECTCVSSVPFVYDPISNIESSKCCIISEILTLSVTGSYGASYNYLYEKPKRSKPSQNRVFTGIYQMNYGLNNQSIFGGYKLSISIGIQLTGTTGITISMSSEYYFVKQVKVSLLIFDNDFYLFDEIFESQDYTFSLYTTTSDLYPVKSSTYKVVKFLTYSMIRTSNSGSKRINIFFTETIGTTDFTMIGVIQGTFAYATVNMKILIVYPQQARRYSFWIEADDYDMINPPLTFSKGFANFDETNSVFLAGLQNFEYNTINDASNPGFSWTISLQSSSLFNALFQTSIDEQFTAFRYSYLLINLLHCPPTHQIFNFNQSTGLRECFDSCYANEYIIYNPIFTFLRCLLCPNPLCASCENETTCSSCVAGYVLDEVTKGCVISGKYYDDGTGSVFPCANSLTGCLNCTSNGGSCTLCASNFVINGGTCTSCSSIVTDCVRCNLTACFECLAPKVLINQTLCSSPIDPQQRPQPNGIFSICTDQNCIECSSTDVSQCFACQLAILHVQNGSCVNLCGDGVIFGTETCDDGNNEDFDGCSTDCQVVQDNFVCDKVPSKEPGFETSECHFDGTVQLDVVLIQKPITENKVHLYFRNSQPRILQWQQIDANNELAQSFKLKIPRFESGDVKGQFFTFSSAFVNQPGMIQKLLQRSNGTSLSTYYNQTRKLQSTKSSLAPQLYQFIHVQVSYFQTGPRSAINQKDTIRQSLNHQLIELTFDPKLTQRNIFTRRSSSFLSTIQLTLKTDDNQVVQWYSDAYYKMVGQISFLSVTVSGLCVFLMVIGLVAYCVDGRNSRQMLVALETAFVVQLVYFTLLGIGEVNPLFMAMAKGLKLSSGYDLLMDSNHAHFFRQMWAVGIESVDFISNVNISFVLVLTCIFLGGFALLLDKFVFSKKSHRIDSKSNNGQTHQNQEVTQETPQVIFNDQDQIHQNEKTNQSQNFTTNQPSRCHKIGMFLVFNAGFGLFLFFLCKYIFFTGVQIKYGINSLNIVSIVVLSFISIIFIVYVVLLVKKPNFFISLTQKLTGRHYKINTFDTLTKSKFLTAEKLKSIEKSFAEYWQNLPVDQKPDALRSISLQPPSINTKLWYFITYLTIHIVNILSCSILSPLTPFYTLLPLLTTTLALILTYKHPPYPSSNLYRLYFTQLTGIVVQSILAARAIMTRNLNADDMVGYNESSLGVYFPFSIISLLFLLCLVALVYSVYGVKRVRCCQLHIDCEKIQMNQTMKMKLQLLVMKETNNKLNDKENLKLLDSLNIHEINQLSDEKHKEDLALTSKNEQTSFCSQDQKQFFNVPLNIKHQLKGVIGIGRQIEIQNMRVNLDIYTNGSLQSQINKQITSQCLKKEIKEKLLNSRLQRKMKRTNGLVDSSDKNLSHSSGKQPSKSPNQHRIPNPTLASTTPHQQQYNTPIDQLAQTTQKDSSSHQYCNKIIQKSKKVQPNKPMQDSGNDFEVGYLYTDQRGYNLYEEFDMI